MFYFQPVPNLLTSTQILPSDFQADLQTLQLESEPSTPEVHCYNLISDDQLTLEIEKERADYNEKNKNLAEQLLELRTEIEGLKNEEKQCDLDQLHNEQVRLGENKYSTLRRVKSGSTEARVKFFEKL